jgi:AraC-like DNA-binding protein
MEDEVVVTHRFLLIREGGMDYTVEGKCLRLRAGAWFFVPAWCRREWSIPKASTGCRLLWCEFSSGAVEVPLQLYRQKRLAAHNEIAAFEALLRYGDLLQDESVALQAEGQLKALLASFWTAVRLELKDTDNVGNMHPELVRAVAWLEQNFARPDALDVFYHELKLSPNHFRLLFKQQRGETVQLLLMRLRLRRARYLVRETSQPLKWVAAETGFSDPLYFSKQYRKFWGRTATADRTGCGVA